MNRVCPFPFIVRYVQIGLLVPLSHLQASLLVCLCLVYLVIHCYYLQSLQCDKCLHFVSYKLIPELFPVGLGICSTLEVVHSCAGMRSKLMLMVVLDALNLFSLRNDKSFTSFPSNLTC